MHLHPKWQKQVIEDLKLAFPNIQFIVTTHSPFIVQSLRANEIINLAGRVGTQARHELESSSEVESKDWTTGLPRRDAFCALNLIY